MRGELYCGGDGERDVSLLMGASERRIDFDRGSRGSKNLGDFNEYGPLFPRPERRGLR